MCRYPSRSAVQANGFSPRYALGGPRHDSRGMSKTDAKRALAALEEIVLEQLGNAEKVRIGG